MQDAAELAQKYFDAWTRKDFEHAREFLVDDLKFEGPLETFDDADSFIASLRQLGGIVTGAETQRVFGDGEEACVIYDLKTAPVPSSRTCEWYRLRDGKIASISVMFDPRPFAPLFEGQH